MLGAEKLSFDENLPLCCLLPNHNIILMYWV